ncbi:hypothetical protein Peur_045714 [Populus x canadensis]
MRQEAPKDTMAFLVISAHDMIEDNSAITVELDSRLPMLSLFGFFLYKQTTTPSKQQNFLLFFSLPIPSIP